MTIEDQPEETLYNTKKMSGYESETMEMGTEKSRRYHSAVFDTQGDNVSREVSERRIRKAVRSGRRRFVSVKQATEAGSSCGMCQPFVEDIIRNELKKNR